MYEAQKNQNILLLNENEILNQKNQEKDKRIIVLENELMQLKIAKALIGSEEDSHEAKQKINRIVREIDKCIALLNK